ncbi:MAG: leucine-rich repeat domain-containing protein [Eubacterium sp.]|nr:leucine-rich repeat domain-containing protein [Eubacterium sp.]
MKKTKRRLLAALLSFVLLMTTVISINTEIVFAATSGTCGDKATWSYNVIRKTLTISGTGAIKDYRDTNISVIGTETAPWREYKTVMTTIVVNSGITEIGDYAFYNCEKVTSVSLPTTLTKLHGYGAEAFDTDIVNLGKTYGCFQECTSLESITLPASLIEIEPFAFLGCTALKRIDIPNNVTTIGNYAFYQCTALNRLSLGTGLTDLGKNSFRETTALKNIAWNENMTTIPNRAFMESGLVRVDIPETITSIGTRAFANNVFLTDFTVRNRSLTFNGDLINGCHTSIVVHGYTGSTAEEFANKYGYPFESLDTCPHEHTHTNISVAATCEGEGTEQTICDDCEQVIRETTIPATGHTWGDPIDVDDQTEENGHVYNTYQCSVCNEYKNEIVHATNITLNPDDLTGSTDIGDIGSGIGDVGSTIGDIGSGIGSGSGIGDIGDIGSGIGDITSGIDTSALDTTVYVWVDGYYTKTVVRDADCTTPGLERYKCEVEGCGQTETHVIPSHHTVTSWVVTKAATCTEDGTRTGKCTICGETVTETIKATGHSYDKDNPNQIIENTEDGHTHKIYTCSKCGESVTEYVHNEWIDGYYTARSTTYDNCELPGVELDVCDLCNEYRTVEIPPKGEHDLYVVSTTDPDCTKRGRINKACHNCNYTTIEYTDALGHDYVLDQSKSEDATCTTQGSNFYKCSRCSNSKTEAVQPLGHLPDESSYVTDKAPDCENAGRGHGTCLRCGEQYNETIPALGHDFQDVEEDLTAEDKPGHVRVTPVCTRCNTRQNAEVVHKEWTEGNYEVNATVPATCITGAQEIRNCKICGTEGRVQVSEPAGHMFAYKGSLYGVPYEGEVTADGVSFRCSICGTKDVKSMEDVASYWTFDVVGSKPNRTGTDNTSYLDMNGDGIINGRDLAYIRNLTAQQEALKAEAEANPPE